MKPSHGIVALFLIVFTILISCSNTSAAVGKSKFSNVKDMTNVTIQYLEEHCDFSNTGLQNREIMIKASVDSIDKYTGDLVLKDQTGEIWVHQPGKKRYRR